jgi:hypothetical protein
MVYYQNISKFDIKIYILGMKIFILQIKTNSLCNNLLES